MGTAPPGPETMNCRRCSSIYRRFLAANSLPPYPYCPTKSILPIKAPPLLQGTVEIKMSFMKQISCKDAKCAKFYIIQMLLHISKFICFLVMLVPTDPAIEQKRRLEVNGQNRLCCTNRRQNRICSWKLSVWKNVEDSLSLALALKHSPDEYKYQIRRKKNGNHCDNINPQF